MSPLLPRGFAALLLLGAAAAAEPKITTARSESGAGFRLPGMPPPRRQDAATSATFTLTDGQRDGNGGTLAALHDGRVPDSADQPGASFFFSQASQGGRLQIDLGREIDLAEVVTYSWHGGTRGPQVYRLYVSDGKAAAFQPAPKRPADPATAGWRLLGSVDTRPASGSPGGQYVARIAEPAGSPERCRYLLFDILPTETQDPFGNTFYSEIDVVDRAAPPEAEAPPVLSFTTSNPKYRFTLAPEDAPDLQEWMRGSLAPALQKWYPIIAAMLPSEGYQPPAAFDIHFTDDYQGVAATRGHRVDCSPAWYRKNLRTEGIGSVIHELVHVVQQYGRRGSQPPGWLVEGIPDYIRWYLFEPETHGADIRPDRVEKVKYSDSYRVSANFLHWATEKYDRNLVPALNAALREGRYTDEIWKTLTGHALEELGEEWKSSLR